MAQAEALVWVEGSNDGQALACKDIAAKDLGKQFLSSKGKWRSLLLALVALLTAAPAAMQAQTFQTIAPLSFTKVFAGADPLPQVITVASTGANFDFSASAVSSTGGNWLSISAANSLGRMPNAITVTVNTTSASGTTLGVGTYTAEIDLISQDGKTKYSVPVSLTIAPSSVASFNAIAGALTFFMPTQGNAPPAQTLGIQNAGAGTLNWSASATTADGGNWLGLSAVSGTAPFTLSKGVNLANLPDGGQIAGAYLGQVALRADGDSVTVPVTVTVGDPVFQQINALSFTQTYAGGDPLLQVITVASTDASTSFDYSSTVASSTGGAWLSISPTTSGRTPSAITVNANPLNPLPVGTYTAEIIFNSQDGTQAMVVPVSLIVEPISNSFFDSLPGELSFSFATKGSAPPLQPVPIRNAGTGILNWTASSSTTDGGSWITLSATSGTAPSMLSVGITPSSLPYHGMSAGIFTGQVVLRTAGDTTTIPVTVTVGDSVFQQINALSFTKVYAGADPLPQVITVGSTNMGFDYSPTVVNSTGGNWLSISPATSSRMPSAITVSVNTSSANDNSLDVGTYTAEIIFNTSGGGPAMVVPVSLTVEPASNAFFDAEPGASRSPWRQPGAHPQPYHLRYATQEVQPWIGPAQ